MDTIVAPITPLVNSSVILIRISGEESLSVLKLIKKQNNNEYKNIEPNRVYYSKFYNQNLKLIDNIIFYYFKSPNSYTGEDVLEISFHGNPLIVREALAAIYSLNIRPAEPGEFTKRAFLNGKLDLTQAEAVSDVITAKSDSGLFYAFNKLSGGLKNKILKIKDMIVEVAAIVEAYIDFPEEELGEEEYSMISNRLKNSHIFIDNLIKTYDLGKICNDSINIAIVGEPNSGKSSLLNALSQKSRAIVSDIPGTTRDYIEETIYIAGLPVNIIDTAGIRKTFDKVESAGIDLAIEKLKSSHLVLVVIDISKELSEEDKHILGITKDYERLIIGNKSDLQVLDQIKPDLIISAKENYNIDMLIDLIKKKVRMFDSDIYETDIVISERHKTLLSETLLIIDNLVQDFDNKSLDLISIDINICLNNLSEITGEIYTEEILDNIFNKFCIGK
jgi:tRNA modification GTPase